MNNKRQLPTKVLSARAISYTNLESWPHDDFADDPYSTNGSTPKPYRWEMKFTVDSQKHGDPSTPTPYAYNGIDVFVGNWIADMANGITMKITSILEKEQAAITVIVEDVDRYNTFLSASGVGRFNVPTECVIFEINDAHLPILSPLPVQGSYGFGNNVMGRFMNNDSLFNYRIYQTSHGLLDGQSIWVDPVDGLFKAVADSESMKRMVGTVDRTGPGLDVFYFVPTTKVVEGLDPVLPGKAGQLIYTNPMTGDLTATVEEYTKVSYIQLTDASPDTTRSTNDTVVPGNILEVNGVDVTFTGTTLDSVVTDLTNTPSHGLNVLSVSGMNNIETVSDDLRFSSCILYSLDASASINGVVVNFNTATYNGGGYPNALDMAEAINIADIPDISANGDTDRALYITNTAGGPINIVNITPDQYGTVFAGPASASGVPLTTAAGGESYITFENPKGNGILFKNTNGSPVNELGLTNSRNGLEPIGLVVEQYVSDGPGGAKVYATMETLPATGAIGEQAFVIDSDDGNGNKVNEWSMLLWDGFSWVKTTDEDSADVDAKSIEAELTFDGGNVTIGTLSDGKRVAQVVVEVITPFDGAPILNIGDSSDTAHLMSDDHLDLSSIGAYSTTANFIYDTGSDVDIIATYSANGATAGTANIIITYI